MTKLISIDEAAEILSVSRAAIRKWIYQRRLPAVKVGRLTRLRRDDVERVASGGLGTSAHRREVPTSGRRVS